MKCIDSEIIQKYIDGETDAQETGRIEKHLAGCSHCAREVETQRVFADAIKRALRRDIEVVVPEFVVPTSRKSRLNLKIRHFMYAVSTAAAAVLLFVFLRPEKHEDDHNITTVQLIYSFDGDFDSNKTVSQQEMTIFMISSDGKVIEYY